MDKSGGVLISIIIVMISLAAAAVFVGRGAALAGVLCVALGLGYILQRSRFCIASAYTDLLVFKDGALFRAVLVFILVSSMGFFFVELISHREGYVVPFGWPTVPGALLFGAGMVLAGGCAAGTIMRLGEGYILFIPVLVGLIIGSTLGACHYPFWSSDRVSRYTVFLPDLVGWAEALFLQVLIIAALWLIIKKWEKQ